MSPWDITCGGNITRYEIYPAVGVGIEKIHRLKQDIAMAICAEQFTLLAPLPGKEFVGIEIPNKRVQKVTLRELLESDEWFRTEAGIPLLLGRDIYSQPVIVDLEQLPHLLIAGNIGSGKSVCLHAIIACLLYRFAPDQLRLIIIDPDVLEMPIYNTLPHLVVPVLTDSKKALLGLRFVITEIDQRYKLVAKAGVRDIAGFNARSASLGIGDDGTPQGPLSVMVVIVTELYSLLFDNAAEFEQAISLIAKKGHIVGVHLIAASPPQMGISVNLTLAFSLCEFISGACHTRYSTSSGGMCAACCRKTSKTSPIFTEPCDAREERLRTRKRSCG